jgi:hypothetical protein
MGQTIVDSDRHGWKRGNTRSDVGGEAFHNLDIEFRALRIGLVKRRVPNGEEGWWGSDGKGRGRGGGGRSRSNGAEGWDRGNGGNGWGRGKLLSTGGKLLSNKGLRGWWEGWPGLGLNELRRGRRSFA